MTTIITTTEGIVDLWGFATDEDPVEAGGAVQLVFGELVKLANPIVENYHSDLFHDATWLAKYLVGPGPHAFSWGCDAWGTAIGTDQDLVCKQRQNVWQCVVYVGPDRRWKLSLTKVQDDQ